MKFMFFTLLLIFAVSEAEARCGAGTRCLRPAATNPSDIIDSCEWLEDSQTIDAAKPICMGFMQCVPREGPITEQVAFCYVDESDGCKSAIKCAKSESITTETVNVLSNLRNKGQLRGQGNGSSGGSK